MKIINKKLWLYLTPSERRAIKHDWKKTNERRCALICMESRNPEQSNELAELQRLAGLRQEVGAPIGSIPKEMR